MDRLRSLSGFIPTAVFIFTVALSIILYESAADSLKNNINNTFDMYVSEMSSAISVRMGTYEQVLRGGEGLFKANGDKVSRQMWMSYVMSLELDRLYPGIQAMGFAKVVRKEELAEHIKEGKASGIPDYSVHPVSDKEEYIVVMMMYPENIPNMRVMGYDLASEPVRAAMLKRAKEVGKTAVSGKIILKQETVTEKAPAGILMAMPIFRNGRLYGYISAPFRVNDLMKGIFGSYAKGVSLQIYDSAIDDKNLMFETKTFGLPRLSETVPLKMYGRTWYLKFQAGDSFFEKFDMNKPILILIGGVVTGMLLSLLLYILLKTRSKAFEMAEQMAQKFYESEERYRRTFEQAAVGIVMTTLDGRFIKANSCFSRISGYSRDELRKRTMLDITYPDDAVNSEGCVSGLVNGSIDTYVTERRIVRKDTDVIWVEITASILTDKSNTPMFIIMIVEDITRRKSAEAELLALNLRQSAILENSLVAIIQVKNRQFEWVNNAFLEMFGYRADEIIGKSTMVIHPDENHFTDFGKFLDSEEVLRKSGYAKARTQFRKRDGSLAWVEVSGKLIEEKDAEPYSLWVMTDVTEGKLAEDKLLNMNTDLESKVLLETKKRMEQERLFMQQGRLAAMGEMIGAIAHQWRQPLNVMSLMVQNIQEEYDFDTLNSEVMDEFVEMCMKQILFMSSTIDDFRNFFRTDKERAEFSAASQIDIVIGLVRQQLFAHNIGISVEKECDARIFGVANEFSQVMLNLITNSKDAFLYSGVGSPFINIKVTCTDCILRVYVSDNAGGIPEDIADKVFDPYFTTKGPEQGTGIGLYMSKLIVKEHFKGKLTFNNVNDGVEFIIEIPALSCGACR
ncbi:PAS domain S-box protein [Seleniivibrio sp.]|uniref:PAS domain S-box protein n=1 Tax=Seleniivibrio sp. TaxID=2898801 RepID=UPI0025D9D06A|nr:PAS domain S-box protein [Seleniivibrio sp.]MCD8553421.1 PAS domain S-box protein [Seleniivibrio sp.]